MKCEKCKKNHDGSYGSGRFCCEACARSFSSFEKREEINRKVSIKLGGTGEKNYCVLCGEVIKAKRKNKYCSIKCRETHRNNIIDEAFANNKMPFFKIATNKKVLIERNGHKCMICGTEKWQGQKVPLVFDHIDGNSDNDSYDNCRIICNNCDALLPTFAGRNVGKSNSKKRMEYRLGRYNDGEKW